MDPSVLDLTFLTETERKWITDVLNRDEALQKKEDERIARLKSKAARTNNATIKKKIKLRSGEWFFDLVQPNKKSFKSGRETVRASIRNKAKSTQHRRPPQPPPPPDVLPQADIIMEEPEQTYVEDDTANRVGSYQEDVESYDSDYNKGSTFASMHEAFVQEIPQSHVSHENETHGEVEASIENSDKQQKQAPVIPENYEYLQLTPDEPEVESEEGKPEPVLKRTGSIRRKSTKREKPQDQAPKIVLTSYDSSSTEAQSEFDEKPAESGPFALIEKDTTDESSQSASIISSTTVTGSSEKFDEYVDDILEQPAEYDTPVTTTDYSMSESDVSVEVVDVVTPSIASDDGLKTIEEEPKSEPQGGTYDGGYQVGQDMQGVEEEVNNFAGYRTPPAILITDVEAEQPQEGEDEGKLKRVNSGRRKIVKKVVKHDASGDEADPAKSPKKKIVKVVKKKAPAASDDQENEDVDDAKAKSPKKKVVRVVKKKDVEKKSDDENVDPGNADQDQPKKKVVKVVKKKEGGDAAPKKKKVVVKKKAAE